MQKFELTEIVYFNGLRCMVTNNQIAMGKKIQISPTGNGEAPAKYFVVGYWEVTKVKP
jgi:hypothetical protein